MNTITNISTSSAVYPYELHYQRKVAGKAQFFTVELKATNDTDAEAEALAVIKQLLTTRIKHIFDAVITTPSADTIRLYGEFYK